jgi:hypothetical protein
MDKDYLILKRASVSRSSGQWSDDDFDVLAEGVVVGRIFKANDEATPRGGYGCVRQRAGGANDLQAAGELEASRLTRTDGCAEGNALVV